MQKLEVKATLNRALADVNAEYVNDPYKVVRRSDTPLKKEAPIFLDLIYKGSDIREPLGVTYFVKPLNNDFDDSTIEKVDRTFEELKSAIRRSVTLHFYAKSLGEDKVLITDSGMIIFKNKYDVRIKEGILYVNEKKCQCDGKPLEAYRLVKEGSIQWQTTGEKEWGMRNVALIKPRRMAPYPGLDPKREYCSAWPPIW